MKPAAFEYFAPDSVEEAAAILNSYGGEARVLAGGQSLVPLLNMRLARPKALVDLARQVFYGTRKTSRHKSDTSHE